MRCPRSCRCRRLLTATARSSRSSCWRCDGARGGSRAAGGRPVGGRQGLRRQAKGWGLSGRVLLLVVRPVHAHIGQRMRSGPQTRSQPPCQLNLQRCGCRLHVSASSAAFMRAHLALPRAFMAYTVSSSVEYTSLTVPCAPRPRSWIRRYWLTNTWPCMYVGVWRQQVGWLGDVRPCGLCGKQHGMPWAAAWRGRWSAASWQYDPMREPTLNNRFKIQHARINTTTHLRTLSLSTTIFGVSLTSGIGDADTNATASPGSCAPPRGVALRAGGGGGLPAAAQRPDAAAAATRR